MARYAGTLGAIATIIIGILTVVATLAVPFVEKMLEDNSAQIIEITFTITPSRTPTRTFTPTFTPSPTPTLTPRQVAEQRAKQQTNTMSSWIPFAETINDIEMMLVPVGCFTMGDNTREESERPAHWQCISNPFYISKHPITNAQYNIFIQSRGYSIDTYWTTEGIKWRNLNNITKPPCWDDRNLNHPEHPVVCVTWYEAYAYANWLGMRLPTEVEWEYAGRGPNGLIYPWGNTFETIFSNYCDINCSGRDWKDESIDDGHSHTSPVWAYPAGVSWIGGLDMSGNVWEWTSTIYNDYPYILDEDRENVDSKLPRVVRGGGSWAAYIQISHLTFRFSSQPNNWSNDTGFRVVYPAQIPD